MPLSLSNDALLFQRGNVGLAHVEVLRQQLVGVLAQRGRRRAHTRLRLGEFDGRVHQLDGAAAAVFDLDYHVTGLGVLEVERVLDVVDGCVGHARTLKDGEPLLGRLLLRQGLDLVLELDAVGDSIGVGLVLGVALPLRHAETLGEDAEEAIVAAAKENVAILGLERLVGNNGGYRMKLSANQICSPSAVGRTVCGSPSAGVSLAANETAAGNVCESRSLAIAQSDINVLALAALASSQQSCHDAVAGVQTSCQVCDGDADLDGRTIASASDVHEAKLGLDHDVVSCTAGIGTGLAITGNRGVDEAWVDLAKSLIVHAVLFQGAGQVIFYENIAFGNELVQNIDAILVLKREAN